MGDLTQNSGDVTRWFNRITGSALALFALFFIWISTATAVTLIGHLGIEGTATIESCRGTGTRNDPYVCSGPVTTEDGRTLGTYSNRRDENLKTGDTLAVWDTPAGWTRDNNWTRGFSVLMASLGLALLGYGITRAGSRPSPSPGGTTMPKLRMTMLLKVCTGLGGIGAIAGIILLTRG